MQLRNKLNNKRVIGLVMVIAVILGFFGVLLLTQKPAEQVVNSINTTPLKNNIASDITEVKFNVSDKSFPKKLPTYTTKTFTSTDLDYIAKNLSMTKSTDETNYVMYKDVSGNTLEFFSTTNTLIITNTSNNNLKDISKDNLLNKLNTLTSQDLSAYYLKDTSTNEVTVLGYILKIQSFDVITDFDFDTSMTAVIDKNNNLTKLTWDVKIPQVEKDVDTIDFNYIKTNFDTIPKAIYPDFAYSNNSLSKDTENLPSIEDFKGRIEINDVEIAYLWSSADKERISPVYRLKTKFFFSSGISRDGSIIIIAT